VKKETVKPRRGKKWLGESNKKELLALKEMRLRDWPVPQGILISWGQYRSLRLKKNLRKKKGKRPKRETDY